METIRVIYHEEAEGWWAESPDVAGWSAAGGTYEEVRRLTEEGLSWTLGREVAANGKTVKELLRANPPDREWAAELADLRDTLAAE